MLVDLLYLIIGCALLYFGGDWLVEGVGGIAKHLHVSPLIVAFVVMGFGTSAPELFVAIGAVGIGSHDIAVGNVVGSNIANLCLVLALTALIQPLKVEPQVILVDGGALLFAAVAMLLVSIDGTVGRVEGACLVLLVLGYVTVRWHGLKDSANAENDGSPVGKAMLLSLLALAALPSGAHLFVEGARDIATELGVSEAIIGLSLVAIGTSLPELAACAVAAIRKQADMILGGILGSNIFNSTIVLGGTATLIPIHVAEIFLTSWIPIMLTVSVIVLILLRTGFVLSRREAGFMLAAYCLIFLIH